jgi:hypothetical protein
MISITPETQNHAQARATSLGNFIGRIPKTLEVLQSATKRAKQIPLVTGPEKILLYPDDLTRMRLQLPDAEGHEELRPTEWIFTNASREPIEKARRVLF